MSWLFDHIVKFPSTQAHDVTGMSSSEQQGRANLLSCCAMMLYKLKVLTNAISSVVLQYPDTAL